MKLDFEYVYDNTTFRDKQNIGTLWTPNSKLVLLKDPSIPGMENSWTVVSGSPLMLTGQYITALSR